MRKTPRVKPPAAEAPALELFPAPPECAPRSVPVKASVPEAAPAQTIAPCKAIASRKPAPTKAAKTIPVRAAPSPSAPVRVVAETPATYFAGTGGRAWRMSGKHAVA